jgi:hypothetical protein
VLRNVTGAAVTFLSGVYKAFFCWRKAEMALGAQRRNVTSWECCGRLSCCVSTIACRVVRRGATGRGCAAALHDTASSHLEHVIGLSAPPRRLVAAAHVQLLLPLADIGEGRP